MEVYSNDSLILFKNTRGITGRGTLVHLTRNVVIFEVYNPYSIVQLSEVVKELQILRGERAIYTGRAVVSNIVTTGLMTIVSATLVDAWSDLIGLRPGEHLHKEIEGFVKSWEASHAISPSYQVIVGKIRGFLSELSRWLEQTEVTSGIAVDKDETEMRQMEIYQEAEETLLGKITELFQNFESEAGRLEPEHLIPHRSYARRELHPLTLCSPFVHRTYTKPLGYAGDYEMVNMMLREPAEGSTVYAKLVNAFNIKTAPVLAHRNRIDMLLQILTNEAERAAREGRTLRVLNIGCGPAIEVQRFVRYPICERCDLNLLDFNEETLEYARLQIAKAASSAGTKPAINFIHKSVDDLLKEAAGLTQGQGQVYDLVYCAGLFDYLSNRTCKRLVQMFAGWTKPGGLVAVTNVHSKNPVRNYMEHVLEWHLIYRNEQGMGELAPDIGQPLIRTDATGVNVFLEIRIPPAAE